MLQRITRRTFLADAAVGTLAMAATGHASTVPRLGIVGCGARGAFWAQQIRDGASRATIAAAYDTTAARAQAIAPVATPSYEALLAMSDIDGIIIATPDAAHVPQALDAIKAGKAVYCESPAAMNLEELNQLSAATENAGAVVQIGAVGVSSAPVAALRWIVEEQVLGPVEAIHAATHAPVDAPGGWRYAWSQTNGVAAQRLFNTLAVLETVLSPGALARVSSAGGVFHGDTSAPPDGLMTTVTYKSGIKVALTTNPMHSQGDFIRVHGNKGWAELGPEGLIGNVEAPLELIEGCVDTASQESVHLSNWLQAITAKTPCALSPVRCRPVQATVDAIMQAYRNRTTVIPG